MARLARRSKPNLGVLLMLLVVLAAVPAAWGQSTLGNVSGTVRDQSGAVIPTATVTLTNSGAPPATYGALVVVFGAAILLLGPSFALLFTLQHRRLLR